jgi:protein TonB
VIVRFRAFGTRLARFVGGSAVAHGALLALVLVVPLTRHRPPPVQDAMVVALAGPIGGGVSAAPKAVAAPPRSKPAEAPAPKEAHAVREVPVPRTTEKREKPRTDPVKKDLPKPPPAGTPEAPADDDTADATPGAGTGSAVPGTATGVTASVGGGDAALGWYGAAVKAALESAWAKPYLEDQGETYSVVIAFDIARDGSTRNVRIVTSSGIPSLDRSAQRAVIEASPLPAVPPAWKDETLPATMRFDLSPESR